MDFVPLLLRFQPHGLRVVLMTPSSGTNLAPTHPVHKQHARNLEAHHARSIGANLFGWMHRRGRDQRPGALAAAAQRGARLAARAGLGYGILRSIRSRGPTVWRSRLTQPLLVLIAGPYRSGTHDDPTLIAANVRAMTAMALAVFRARHVPVMGEWLALPLIERAGSQRGGDAVFDEIFHPAAPRLAAKSQRCHPARTGAARRP